MTTTALLFPQCNGVEVCTQADCLCTITPAGKHGGHWTQSIVDPKRRSYSQNTSMSIRFFTKLSSIPRILWKISTFLRPLPIKFSLSDMLTVTSSLNVFVLFMFYYLYTNFLNFIVHIRCFVAILVVNQCCLRILLKPLHGYIRLNWIDFGFNWILIKLRCFRNALFGANFGYLCPYDYLRTDSIP